MIGLLVLLAALYGLRAWFYWAKRRDIERTEWHPYEVTDACRFRWAK